VPQKLVIGERGVDREVRVHTEVTVGRDPVCDISSDDPALSRRHAAFSTVGDQTFVRDLNSANGVSVNGRRITGITRVQSGDAVEIAGLQIRVFEDSASGGSSSPSVEDEQATSVQLPPEGATLVPRRSEGPRAPRRDRRVEREDRREPVGSVVASASSPAAAADRPHRLPWLVRLAAVLFVPGAAALIGFALAGASSALAVAERGDGAHLQTLSNWLAADLRASIARGARGEVDSPVFREPSVESALVFTDDGYVLAPQSRAGELLHALPGRTEAIAKLTMSQSIPGDGFVDAYTVVRPPEGKRLIGWLRYRSSPAPRIAPRVLVAVGLASAGAVLAAAWIRRAVSHALARFKSDIDAALGGRREGPGDPLGIRAFAELAETVNYLIARRRER